MKTQLGISNQMSVIKIKVTAAKNNNSVYAQKLKFAFAY
jgi:hypothetical protein